VYAARDSQLARLSREVFDALTQLHPQALRRITGFVIERLRRQSAGVRSAPRVVSLAVVPARPGADLQRLVARLAAALQPFGSVEVVDRAAVERALGRPGIADAGDENSQGMRLVRWLNERDLAAQCVIYQADPEWTRWTERALRQADHVLIVAMTKHGPELGENEQRLAEIWRKARAPSAQASCCCTLPVRLHATPRRGCAGVTWSATFTCAARVRRTWHGLRAYSLGAASGSCSAAGARAGWRTSACCVRSRRTGIPIDSVGGTSIGAIIGALPAMGFDAQGGVEICRRSFSALFDPTFPVVSLLTGTSHQHTPGGRDRRARHRGPADSVLLHFDKSLPCGGGRAPPRTAVPGRAFEHLAAGDSSADRVRGRSVRRWRTDRQSADRRDGGAVRRPP
jgi:hypothetical protein